MTKTAANKQAVNTKTKSEKRKKRRKIHESNYQKTSSLFLPNNNVVGANLKSKSKNLLLVLSFNLPNYFLPTKDNLH